MQTTIPTQYPPGGMSRKRFGALMFSNVVASARAALMHSSRCLAALSMSEGVFTSGRGPRFPWIRFLTRSKFTRLTMRGSFRMGSLSASSRSRMMGLWSELPSMIVHVSATYCPPRRMAMSMTSALSIVISSLILSMVLCMDNMVEFMILQSGLLTGVSSLSLSLMSLASEWSAMSVKCEQTHKDREANVASAQKAVKDLRSKLDKALEENEVTEIKFLAEKEDIAANN
nr:unnamed protein product [Callosobruchus analis]